MMMISGYQSREIGLGLGSYLTPEILENLNINRAGKRYISSSDALMIYNCDLKPALQSDPLVKYFKCGANKEGYWNSAHTKLQL